MTMIKGITVTLYEKEKINEDAFGKPIYKETPIKVKNVLVAPTNTSEILDTLNLTGKKAVYTIAIPKGDEHVWEDNKVEFFGETWKVIGLPQQGMLNTDEEALVCDFAETYRIYNYKEIPCKMAAIYAKGLKENARIKMKLAGVKVTLEDMLLASIADHTKLLTWMQTEDARKGRNRPKTILPRLLGEEERKIISFETGEEFEKEWKRLTEKG